MNKVGKQMFYDFISSLIATFVLVLLLVGQIVFAIIGIRLEWGIENVLGMSLGAFFPLIVMFLLYFLFGAWSYWSFDENGVVYWSICIKRKFMYTEINRIKIKNVAIGYRNAPLCYCFYKGKKRVVIPLTYLSEEEKEWLEEKTKHCIIHTHHEINE